MYQRFLREKLAEQMGFFPAAMMVGARQSGKTTLAKALEKELKMSYSSFDEMANLISVQLDPIQYLDSWVYP